MDWDSKKKGRGRHTIEPPADEETALQRVHGRADNDRWDILRCPLSSEGLGADGVANAVGDEDDSSGNGLLSTTGDIGRKERPNEEAGQVASDSHEVETPTSPEHAILGEEGEGEHANEGGNCRNDHKDDLVKRMSDHVSERERGSHSLHRRLGFFRVMIPTKRNQQIETTSWGILPFTSVSKGVKPNDTYTRFPNDVVPPFGNELIMTVKKKK